MAATTTNAGASTAETGGAGTMKPGSANTPADEETQQAPSGNGTQASACQVQDLEVTLEPAVDTEGKLVYPLVARNASAKPCTISGTPKIAFIVEGDKTVAPAAQGSADTPMSVELESNLSVAAYLEIKDPTQVPNCQPVTANRIAVGIDGHGKQVSVEPLKLCASTPTATIYPFGQQ